MTLETIMKKISEKYGLLIDKLTDEIALAPAGSLYCKKEKDHFKWYRISDTERKRTYIAKKDINLAVSLASKMLKQKKLEDIRKEKYAIDQYLRHHHFSPSKEETFLNHANSEFRRLVSLSYKCIDKRYDEWQYAPFQSNPYNPEHKRIRTLRGDLVRSKSEAMIADYLFLHNIPYRYECVLVLNGHTIYPDFIVIDPLTGDHFIIEHFGMMDDKEYFSKYINRMQIYADADYYPDSNLICFYETEKCPLDSATVSNKLDFFLNIKIGSYT